MSHPKSFHVSLGDRGEMIAWGYLLREGYQILEKNYRCALGEIDVIAKKDKRLIFVEIKTRSQERFGSPQAAVTEQKQKRLIRLAQWYMKEKSLMQHAVSFHVVAILILPNEEPKISLFRDAFNLNEAGPESC